MSETLKTVTFVGAAVVVVAIATIDWTIRQPGTTDGSPEMQGERLFAEFAPLDATTLEIVEFDEETATVRPFTVAQVEVDGDGKLRWSLPTHANYPADAEDQVADAAASLMGLKVLEVAGSGPADHEEFGVLDPDPDDLKGTQGVGTRVTMRNRRGKVLMSLIIGKEVPGRPELHYVRKVDEDPVYTVKVSTSNLSTKFKDWIEEDLLKLSTWDIKQVQIHDHSVDELARRVIQRGRMTLEYDDTGEDRWKLIKDQAFQDGQWVPRKMADDEELDTSKLDDLKYALDDLEIVDVSRKPPGLSADLKAGADFINNEEAVNSLMARGFYPADLEGRLELVSNEGEVRCLMKDGAEYVLRFGEIAGGSAPSGKEDSDDEGGDSGSTGLNRYIFVMAEFNPHIIPKPELEPLPEKKEKPTGGETAKSETPEEETEADQPPEGKPTEEPAEEPAGESAEEPTQEKADEGVTEEKAADGPPAEQAGDESAGKNSGGEPAEEKTGGASTEETASDESTEEKTDDSEAADEPDIEAERERIKKENQRKQDEYEKKIEDGKKKVKELNERFADWYYIIPDDVYQKIHLSRDQIVKKKEKEEDEKDAADQGEQAAPDADDTGADTPETGSDADEADPAPDGGE